MQFIVKAWLEHPVHTVSSAQHDMLLYFFETDFTDLPPSAVTVGDDDTEHDDCHLFDHHVHRHCHQAAQHRQQCVRRYG